MQILMLRLENDFLNFSVFFPESLGKLKDKVESIEACEILEEKLVFSNSTSLSGGNLVDGLPPARHFESTGLQGYIFAFSNFRDIFNFIC